MIRRLLLLAGVFVAFPALAGATARPNVLFVIVDDLNCDVACYGASVETPHIDSLAGRGTRFEHAYAQGTACHPSRSSMLTGRTPLATGVLDNHADWRERLPDATTLARHFRDNGYTTARAGKFAHRGYDDREAWVHGGKFRARPAPKRQTRTQRHARSEQMDRWGSSGPGEGEGLPDYQVADEAIGLLQQLDEKPFFLAVGFDGPHAPLKAPYDYFQLYKGAKKLLPKNYSKRLVDPFPMVRANTGLFSTNRRKRDMGSARQAIRAYRAVTSFLDTQLGRVLAELDRLGLREETLIIFTSDHGYHLGERGYWGKNTLYDRGLRVPLIIAGPGVTAGATSRRPVQLLDLYPTLVELAALPSPGELDGNSVAALLRDADARWPHVARSWLARGKVSGVSVRDERYRYTEWSTDPITRELYDHESDPLERTNLAGDASLAKLRSRLAVRLRP